MLDTLRGVDCRWLVRALVTVGLCDSYALVCFLTRPAHSGFVSVAQSDVSGYYCRQIVDVDDFTRKYLARHTPSSDRHWQTAPMWAKLLNLATATGTGVGARAAAAAAAAGDGEAERGSFSRPPVKCVKFDGNEDYGDGGAAVRRQSETSDADGGLSNTARFSETADKQRDGAGGSGPESSAIFARLWAECIGDNACDAFAPDDDSVLSGCGGKSSVSHDPAFPSLSPQQAPALSNHSNHPHLGPWERLAAALRDDRGIDVSRVLTAQERTLLEREVADWLGRSQGRPGQAAGQGKGMAERLASAASAALRQKDGSTSATAATGQPGGGGGGGAASQNETTGAAAVAAQERGSGGSPTADRGRLSVGGHGFPAVVVEESSPPSPVGGGGTTKAERDGGRPPSGTAGDGATAARSQKPGRPLDARAVALDAHEVRCLRIRVFFPRLILSRSLCLPILGRHWLCIQIFPSKLRIQVA